MDLTPRSTKRISFGHTANKRRGGLLGSGYRVMITMIMMIIIIAMFHFLGGPMRESLLTEDAIIVANNNVSSSTNSDLSNTNFPARLSASNTTKTLTEVNTIINMSAAQLRSPESQDGFAALSSPYPEFWTPLNCHDLLNRYEASEHDTNKGLVIARKTKTSAPFWVSLHQRKMDRVRWNIMEHGLYYERGTAISWEDILSKSPANARVLDVGGNIGWYTLLAASMGHHVDTFELLEMNHARLCQSIVLNEERWRHEKNFQQLESLPLFTTTEDEIHKRDSSNPLSTTTKSVNPLKHATIHIHPYGISDTSGSFEVGYPRRNPGSARILTPTADRSDITSKTWWVNLTTLDTMADELGWFQRNAHIAILKIDVEYHESVVVAGAQRLLKSGMVHNIFMEVSAKKSETIFEDYKDNNHHNDGPMLKFLCQTFRLHQFGTWRGPENPLPEDMPSSKDPEGQARYIVKNWIPPNTVKAVNLWFVKR